VECLSLKTGKESPSLFLWQRDKKAFSAISQAGIHLSEITTKKADRPPALKQLFFNAMNCFFSIHKAKYDYLG
jgi:hypothetical protein